MMSSQSEEASTATEAKSSLTQDQMAAELSRCETDRVYFAEKYCYIQDPTTFRSFLFELWDFQPEVFTFWDENPKSVILKTRQIGITWLVACKALHMAIFKNNSNTLSQLQRAADD